MLIETPVSRIDLVFERLSCNSSRDPDLYYYYSSSVEVRTCPLLPDANKSPAAADALKAYSYYPTGPVQPTSVRFLSAPGTSCTAENGSQCGSVMGRVLNPIHDSIQPPRAIQPRQKCVCHVHARRNARARPHPCRPRSACRWLHLARNCPCRRGAIMMSSRAGALAKVWVAIDGWVDQVAEVRPRGEWPDFCRCCPCGRVAGRRRRGRVCGR
ncbi:hypothetical protein VTK56DRAFT_8155 [Thermocarpiscus australiensis]